MPITARVASCELIVLPEPVPYRDGIVLQESYVKELAEGRGPERFVLLQHPHVITLGRGFHPENLLFSQEWLAEKGVTVEDTGRGGDVTYHGPGQVVGYPILDISSKPDLHLYLRNLEDLMIRCVGDFKIEAERKRGLTGIWVGEEKIGAIGVRVSRWITSHGFALNVNTDLSFFNFIVPCGIRQHGVTSLQKILGQEVPLDEIHASLARHFEDVFERRLYRAE